MVTLTFCLLIYARQLIPNYATAIFCRWVQKWAAAPATLFCVIYDAGKGRNWP